VLLFLPPYCPGANPIERCFGDLHDQVTRNHRRQRMPDLGADAKQHLSQNGPWRYQLSELYQANEVTQARKQLSALASCKVA
jgi:transposase